MRRMASLLVLLTALGILVERWARGLEALPSPGLVLVLVLLFSAGVFLLVEDSLRRSQKPPLPKNSERRVRVRHLRLDPEGYANDLEDLGFRVEFGREEVRVYAGQNLVWQGQSLKELGPSLGLGPEVARV
ncbi:hypothetical protein [Thermus scotoductus]|uniref:Uncharacterized protein n=1 Tax=Thermus scotoductus TaxID=37636 RepID=A0A430RZV5_THESC|nr:hypothetical protein [Thermus scotoductus]RTG97050.1 hypothetical protein CSW51_03970 [Thermus scotoductus]RTH26732.1 hypothetical protein CSW38_05235 [Thermus scotoductus]